MAAVLGHYAQTGEVLGKGTHELEGYTVPDKGYFGPGELPHFDAEFFHVPQGRLEEWAIQQLKERIQRDGDLQDEDLAKEFGAQIVKAMKRPSDFMEELYSSSQSDEALPSHTYFLEEPEFKEDL